MLLRFRITQVGGWSVRFFFALLSNRSIVVEIIICLFIKIITSVTYTNPQKKRKKRKTRTEKSAPSKTG